MEAIPLILICAPRHLAAILAIQENGPATCLCRLDVVIEIGDGLLLRDVDLVTIAQTMKAGMITHEDEPTSQLSDPVFVHVFQTSVLDWAQTLSLMNHFNGNHGTAIRQMQNDMNFMLYSTRWSNELLNQPTGPGAYLIAS